VINVETNAQAVAEACRRYAQALPGVLRGALELWALVTRDVVSRAAPVRTGVLSASIQYGSTGAGAEPDCFVVTAVEYAPHVEFGTEEHEILPVNKQALRFPASAGHGAGDGWQFAAAVDHPGTDAQPFFFGSIESEIHRLEPLTQDATTKLGDACFRRLGV